MSFIMKRLTKQNIMLTSLATCFAICTIGCDDGQYSPEISYATLYADSAYLEFEGNLFEPLYNLPTHDHLSCRTRTHDKTSKN